MAEDIDELLREVEEKFLSSAQIKTEHKSSSAKNRVIINKKQFSKAQSSAVLLPKEVEEDIVEILEDCMGASGNVPQKLSPRKTHSASELTATPAASASSVKCFPVLLSGVLSPEEAAKYPKICNSLRCYNCDFRVGQFNHLKWRPGTDYLFLRNNMPEFDRVRVKLATAKHHKAYACQCKFITIKNVISIADLGPDFAKWNCAGH